MESLNNLLNEWNIVLSDYQIDQFKKYYELLIEWNSFMNLTSITDKNEVILKHFADSIALFRYLNLSDESLIDESKFTEKDKISLSILSEDLID